MKNGFFEGANGRLSKWRTHTWYKLLDAVVIAPLTPSRSNEQHWHTLRHSSSNYKKVAAAFCLLHHRAPNLAEWLHRRCYQPIQLPLASEAMLLGFGFGSTVLQLATTQDDYVLKVYRRSMGLPVDALFPFLEQYRDKYAFACRWYNGRFQLVPSCHFLILQGHIRGVQSAAIIQPYFVHHPKDILHDFSEEALRKLLDEHPQLRAELSFFAEQTRAMMQEGICFDFLGKHNLMLIQTGTSWSLQIIDYGLFDLNSLMLEEPEKVTRLEEKIAWLLAIVGETV